MNELYKKLEEMGKRLAAVERRPVQKSGKTFEAPTGLTSTAQTDSTISLSWIAPVTNETIVSYKIYRNGLLAGSSTTISYIDTGLVPGTSYTYRVSAISDRQIEGELSVELIAITTGIPIDTEAPTTPQNFGGSATSSAVTLSWSPATDNVAVTGYTIYRNGVPIVSTAALSYIDSNVVPGTNYIYTVDAFDAAGNHSGQSNSVNITVPQPPSQSTWYVSVDGSASNEGTLESPWSLDHALNGGGGGQVLAGHTIYILGSAPGTNYNLTASQVVTGLTGSAGSPIVIRPYPGHRVGLRNSGGTFGSLHSSLILRDLSYVDFKHLELTMYSYTRSPEVPAGGTIYHVQEDEAYTQSHLRFFNCQFHDCAGSAIYSGESSDHIEYNGCYFFYNGSSTTLDHNVIVFGAAGSNKIFRDCVFGHSAAGGFQGYATAGEALEDMDFIGNVFTALGSLYNNPDRGIFLSGEDVEVVRNCLINNNFYYQPSTITIDPDTQALKLGSSTGSTTPDSGQFTIVSNGDDGRWGSDGAFTASANLGTVGLASGGVDYNDFYRFQSVNIPQGATITSATLTLQFGNSDVDDTLDLVVRGDDSDNSTAPTTAAEANGKAKTTAQVDWDWVSWLQDTNYVSPDLGAIVQEIVDRPGWASGNALQLFLMENGGSTNDAWPYHREHTTGPEVVLNIEWEVSTGGGTETTWGPTQISSNSDDGRWDTLGNFDNSANLAQVGYGSSAQWSSFFRFPNVTIPAGATITSAFLDWYSANADVDDTINMHVRGDKSTASPTAPTTAADAVGRARTTEQVAWQIVSWTSTTLYTSPNIAQIIQELVSQGTWASGNAMVLFLDENNDTSSNDIWIATLEHSTLQAPRLTITYETGGAGTPVENVTSQSNFFARGQLDLSDPDYTNVDFSNNVVYFPNSHVDNTQTKFPSNTWSSTEPATGATKFVRVYDWDGKRANVVIYNWGQASTVTLTAVDLAGLTLEAGEPYELRNMERYYSDVVTGIYDGTSIVVPMTGRTQASPVGISTPPTLFPRFGVFQLVINGGSDSPPLEDDSEAPTVPAGLSATAVSESQINLSWTASTDNVAVAGYRIRRNGAIIATTSSTSYSNTGLAAGTLYQYTVSAYDSAGNESAESTSASATTSNPPPPPSGDAWYVSPSGSSGNTGAIGSPWSLTYALTGASGQIDPGDTVYLRGGNYNLSNTYTISADGSSGNPISYRAYPGEVPRILNSYDGSQGQVNGGSYLDFYDIVWEGTGYTRPSSRQVSTGAEMSLILTHGNATFIRFFGCHFKNSEVHGVREYSLSNGIEYNGCFFVLNGASARYDHGVYLRGVVNVPKIFRDCVFAHNSGYGIHGWGYSSTHDQDEHYFYGCTSFQNGSLYASSDSYRPPQALIGGATGSQYDDGRIENCTFYTNISSSAQNIRICYGNSCDDLRFVNNIMAGGYFNADWSSITGVEANSGNAIYSTSSNSSKANSFLDSGSGNTRQTSLPTSGSIKQIRTFNWDSRRAKIVLFNWANASSLSFSNAELVNAGLTISAGNSYELHNAENYFGDVITGTYNGTSITVPMTGRTVETPLGLPKPPSAFPKFGCFILITKP